MTGRRAWLWIAITCGGLAGCANPYQIAPVRGRVTCQGKPAAGATIEFRPVDAPGETGRPQGNPGRPSMAVLGPDGTFALALVGGQPGLGAVTGRHRVLFKLPPRTPRKLSGDDRAVMSPAEIKEWEEKLAREVYPPLTCGANISPGEVTVKPGDNEFEFTLQPN